MRIRSLAILLLVSVAGAVDVAAQQLPNVEYRPAVKRPAFTVDTGPRVVIDDMHHNFHTANGRYRPFADLLRRDGYRVDGLGKKIDNDVLQTIDTLVIVNALNQRNKTDWSLPTPSAFSSDEVDAVRRWVEAGGSLLLIADHMPFPGAASELAGAFGVTFSNGYARPGHRKRGRVDTFESQTGLMPSVITNGRYSDERVTKIATFGGSAFVPPMGATPVILFGKNSWSHETTRAPGITPDAKKVSIEGWCQGAVFSYGQGRVAVFGEAAMFTAQWAGRNRRPMGMNAPGAEQNYQLALNVMHWLTRVTDSGSGASSSCCSTVIQGSCCPRRVVYRPLQIRRSCRRSCSPMLFRR